MIGYCGLDTAGDLVRFKSNMQEQQLKSSPFPRGSEWRRWDLHVHTPDSKLGKSFEGTSWEQYIDELEKAAAASEIAVIGVTDYMSIDGYEKLHAAHHDKDKKRLAPVHLLIPNIEFRLMPPTKDSKALNLHILVDPTSEDHIARIKRSLANLQVEYGGERGERYGCTREQLIEFARAQRPELKGDDEAAYKFGIEQFKPDFSVLKKWYEGESWLKENSIIAVANGKDGISGLPLDGFSATRDELLKLCHFVFSGMPADRDHYLGKKAGISVDDIKRQYRSLKPCLHGSDAHSVDRLFKPDQDRFCWIKADPTFEGLRQVLWEPDARVHVGKSKPQLSDESRVISNLKITNSKGWFSTDQIDLNPGLVVVIGEKGSGKTAIADLIAFAAGVPADLNSQSSFVAKGRLHLAGVKSELAWCAGTPSSGTLISAPHVTQRPLVRYLSQDFVERLCSADTQGQELQDAIEEVVFSYLDEVRKEGFSSFAELRKAREAASQAKRDTFRGELATLHKEIERLQASIAQKPSKEAQKKQIEQQIEELKKQLPAVAELANQEILKKLEQEQAALTQVEQLIAAKTRQRRSIEDGLKAYRSIKERTDKQIQELIDSASFEEMSKDTLVVLKPTWDSSAESILETVIVTLVAEIKGLQGDPEAVKPEGNSQADISARIKSLRDSVSKDEINRRRLLDLQKEIGEREANVKRIAKEIDDLEGKVRKQLAQKEKDRHDMYLQFFASLGEDEQGLRELYAPMKEQLETLGAEMKFELSVGYRVDAKAWIDKASRFYDARRSFAADRKDEIEKFAFERLTPAWKSGEAQQIEPVFSEFLELVAPVAFMSDLASPSLKLVDLYDWLYSTDHISISYKILYGGTELEYLSPGTRGIALLVLYLLMDEDDRRPLIIDQPEGNLDNSSIYQQLVPYIRKAKEKRQIVLVTHNPNLVVASDAEQVIVAIAERPTTQTYPQIKYVSGALEHAGTAIEMGVRQAVCTLLEGGARAFQEREVRYSLPKK